MAWFSIWPPLQLFAFLVYTSMTVIILSRVKKGQNNMILITSAALFSCFALWSFCKILIQYPGTPFEMAGMFDKTSGIGVALFPALALLLMTLHAGNKKLLKSRLFFIILAAMSVLFIYLHLTGQLMQGLRKTGYGWFNGWKNDSPWTYLYYFYYIGFVLLGALLFYLSAEKSGKRIKKKQARISNISILIVMVIGTYTDVIMPWLKLPGYDTPFSDSANLYIMIWAAATFYSIYKYELYTITPATAADNIIANMSEALFLLDVELKIIYANDSAHALLNYAKNGLFTKPFVSLLKEKNDINGILKTALTANSISGHETVFLRRNGSPVPVILSFNTLSEAGDIKGFSCIATDITERKISEVKIRMERDRAQKYLDTAEVMFLVLDLQHKITLMNKKGSEILGYSEKELLYTDWIENYIPERFRKDMSDVFEQIVFNNNVAGDVENFILTKNGKERLIRWSNTVLKSDSGDITGVLSAGIDITEQALAQEEIKKLSVAVQQSPSSIVITDINGYITYVNPKFTEITGYTKEAAMGKNPSILKSGEWPMEKYKELWDTITSGRQWRGVFHNKKSSGELFWESASISPIKNYKGEILSYIAIKEDITAQKKAEEELKASYEKLKELDMMKTGFTSMVSHELRTPLTSIKGFLAFLLSGVAGKVNPQQKEFLEIIRSNSERLLNLINDILDVSKMEAGNFTLDKKPCNLIEIAGSSIKDIYSIADRKNIKIEIESLITNPVINADAYRMSQVIINLINNAIKFSPQNSTIKLRIASADLEKIEFPAHFNDPKPLKNCLLISVADNGIGIKQENLSKIFTRFYQVENINTRHAQGTGLGLSIARNIVDAHGGCMWVDSEGEGKGAVFSFLLPVD